MYYIYPLRFHFRYEKATERKSGVKENDRKQGSRRKENKK